MADVRKEILANGFGTRMMEPELNTEKQVVQCRKANQLIDWWC